MALPDEKLEDVAGGFQETYGWAAGAEIHCPACGNQLLFGSDGNCNFAILEYDNIQKINIYECRCGAVFGADKNYLYY